MALEPSRGWCPGGRHLLREEYGNLRRDARILARRIADVPADRESRRRAWLPAALILALHREHPASSMQARPSPRRLPTPVLRKNSDPTGLRGKMLSP